MTAEQLRASLAETRQAAIAAADKIPGPFRAIALAFVETIDQVAGAIVGHQAELEARIGELDKQNQLTHQVLSERIRKLEAPR